MTKRHDLDVRQGADWSFVYTHLDSGGAAVDLTGYSARAAVKLAFGGSTEIYFSTGSDANGGSIALGGANGTVTLSMTAAQAANILTQQGASNPKQFIYDLELVDGSGVITRALEGRMFVYRQVTG